VEKTKDEIRSWKTDTMALKSMELRTLEKRKEFKKRIDDFRNVRIMLTISMSMKQLRHTNSYMSRRDFHKLTAN
jgi:hypothetical protein